MGLLSCRRHIEGRGGETDPLTEDESGKQAEGGGAVWKNCPVTSVQQACIGECAMSVH